MLASCGGDNDIKLFDKREGKVVKIIPRVHNGYSLEKLSVVTYLYCGVSLYQYGEMEPYGRVLATGSDDRRLKCTDFRTEKILCDKNNPSNYKRLILGKFTHF